MGTSDSEPSTECRSGGLTVISGHNLFKEGLKAFHPIEGPKFYSSEASSSADTSERLYGYLLFDFKLTEDWDFGSFVIEKSIEICHNVISPIGDECVKSFVSPVLLPEWVKHINGHLFLLGLSSICSFCISRPVYSPRDFLLVKEENLEGLQSFFDRINNIDAIENLKVITKTSTDHNMDGRFTRPLQFPHGSNKWAVNITFGGNLFISIFLDKNLKIVDTHSSVNLNVNETFVVKTPDLRDFSMLHAVRVRGAGPIWDVHSDILKLWKEELDLTLTNLFSLEYEGNNKDIDYKKSIQAMRLIQLAHQNYKEDFDLSFSFFVAAIEAIAQIAIPQKKIEKHPEHSNWKTISKNDDTFKKLFEHYIELRRYVSDDIKNRDLTERFACFILKYYPINEWEVVDEQEIRLGFGNNKLKTDYNRIRKSEVKPENFDHEHLKQIIKETYKYRSNFFHSGKSTPHFIPIPNHIHRYFQSVYDEKEFKSLMEKLDKENRSTLTNEESKKIKIHLINHDLMKMMAKQSIYNYLNDT